MLQSIKKIFLLGKKKVYAKSGPKKGKEGNNKWAEKQIRGIASLGGKLIL